MGKYKIKKWWRKQNLAIKAALIAGCFGIFTTCIGVITPILLTTAEYIITNKKGDKIPVITVQMGYAPPFSVGTFYVIDAKKEFFILATGNCIEISGYGAHTRIPKSENGELSGFISIYLITDSPIIIEEVSFSLLESNQLQASPPFSIHYDLSPKGGGEVIEPIYINERLVFSKELSPPLIIKKNLYKVPGNDVIYFAIPSIFLTSGQYTIQARLLVNTFSSRIEILSEPVKFNWVYLPSVNPSEVQTDMEKMRVDNCK